MRYRSFTELTFWTKYFIYLFILSSYLSFHIFFSCSFFILKTDRAFYKSKLLISFNRIRKNISELISMTIDWISKIFCSKCKSWERCCCKRTKAQLFKETWINRRTSSFDLGLIHIWLLFSWNYQHLIWPFLSFVIQKICQSAAKFT